MYNTRPAPTLVIVSALMREVAIRGSLSRSSATSNGVINRMVDDTEFVVCADTLTSGSRFMLFTRAVAGSCATVPV